MAARLPNGGIVEIPELRPSDKESPLTRKQKIIVKLANFTLGWIGIFYEAVISEQVRIPLLIVYTAMIGVPFAMGSDEGKNR